MFGLIFKRRRPGGSLIGGIRETQKLDFCARHGIVPDVETISMKEINEAYERMLRGKVKDRLVIDMATLRTE